MEFLQPFQGQKGEHHFLAAAAVVASSCSNSKQQQATCNPNAFFESLCFKPSIQVARNDRRANAHHLNKFQVIMSRLAQFFDD